MYLPQFTFCLDDLFYEIYQIWKHLSFWIIEECAQGKDGRTLVKNCLLFCQGHLPVPAPALLEEKKVAEVQKLAIIYRCPSSPSSLPQYFFQKSFPLSLLLYCCILSEYSENIFDLFARRFRFSQNISPSFVCDLHIWDYSNLFSPNKFWLLGEKNKGKYEKLEFMSWDICWLWWLPFGYKMYCLPFDEICHHHNTHSPLPKKCHIQWRARHAAWTPELKAGQFPSLKISANN